MMNKPEEISDYIARLQEGQELTVWDLAKHGVKSEYSCGSNYHMYTNDRYRVLVELMGGRLKVVEVYEK